MTKKKAAKPQRATLIFQPHHNAADAFLPVDRTAWLSQLEASLSTVHAQRITYVDLGAGSFHPHPSISSSLSTSPPPHVTPPVHPLPRYTLIIIDHSSPHPPTPPTCGVLILAQGRELEYLFSQPEGQLSLARQHSFHRLILVRLNRTHRFTSLTSVQDELRPFVPSLLPPSTVMSGVPFLALSSDLGHRKEVGAVDSPVTGEVLVEDIQQGKEWTRRLLFVRTGCVQSEARLLQPPAEGRPPAIDFAWLSCAYQRAFIAALSLLPHPPTSLLLIGLGAGSLPMFLSLAFPLATLTIIELDPEVVHLATTHFGFAPSPRTSLIIDDGLAFLAATPHTYDLLIVDCNASDLSSGLSFPPPAFLSPPTLHRIRSLARTPGLFLLNFGCRSSTRRADVLHLFTEVWGERDAVFEVDVDVEDVNTVLVGRRGESEGGDGGKVTRAMCRAKMLTGERVEEERRKAEGGEEVKTGWRWSGEWKLKEMVDAIHVIERGRGEEGERQVIKKPLPEGTEGEGGKRGEGLGEEEENDGGQGEGAGLSAEEKKRDRARAKRARQKLKRQQQR